MQVTLPPPVANHYDISWVQQQMKEFPELQWLAEGEVRATPEGFWREKQSWSEVLYGEKKVEFDRTVTTLTSLSQIVANEYDLFVADQPESERLSPEAFERLQSQAKELLTTHPSLGREQVLTAMKVALLFGDLGKSKTACENIAKGTPLPSDHDDIYEVLLDCLEEHPERAPTYQKLPHETRALLRTTDTLVHYGHVTHLEGGPNMFTKLFGDNAPSPYALSFDQFIHVCDVAGARGHQFPGSGRTYSAPVDQALRSAYDACRKPSPEEAFTYLLDTRAEWVALPEDLETSRRHFLARLAAMLRMTTPEQGEELLRALPTWSDQEWTFFIQALAPDDRPTPTYMPAVLINLQQSGGLSSALENGVRFLAELLQRDCDPSIRLQFDAVARHCSEQGAVLASSDWTIQDDGRILRFRT